MIDWLKRESESTTMKLSRLHGRKSATLLLDRGHVWKGQTMVIWWLPQAPRHPAVDRTALGLYVGTLASKKLHTSAVKRNRMRRRCREALRVQAASEELKMPVMMLVIPRIRSLTCDYTDIVDDVREFLKALTR